MFPFLFGLFIAIIVIQIGFYAVLFSQFSFARKQLITHQKYAVSVIIACRNEADNLKKNIPKIVSQEFQTFEIVLVDDASTDATLTVMEAFAKKYNNIHYFSIPKTNSYTGNKKNAITLAIQKAQFEHLLFTDADCEPKTRFWIEKMSAQFSDIKQFVLGYGGYQKASGWLNKLIRYETLTTASQYFSYAKVGLPYMGVGRNMAYTKSLFKKANGFQSHESIKSGDDDLLVNQMGTKDNVAICWQADSHTLSQPETTLAKWLHQKRRHITTATSYKPICQILLGLFYISQLLFYMLLIILLIFGYITPVIVFLIAVRYFFYYLVIIFTAKKLNERDLILWAPLLEFFLIVIQMRIFIKNLVQKPIHW